MNADFEVELAQAPGPYRRTHAFESLNRRLSPHLLWLTSPGDALLIDEPWPESLCIEARRRGVELVLPSRTQSRKESQKKSRTESQKKSQKKSRTESQKKSLTESQTESRIESGLQSEGDRLFTPWGWTRSAAEAGERGGSKVSPIPFDVVARVNSKLWSHALEVELGWSLKGSATARTLEELCEAAARACAGSQAKWVIKSPYGFAARERVLGRGPRVEGPQATWATKRLARGETLVFQPWLEVVREYGVVLEIGRDGSHLIQGVSDLQTNGAGTGTGYILARPPAPRRMAELERTAAVVCKRLFAEGYYGPAGIDAIEHAGGLHPLLEVNARYTMGFVAVAVERSLKPSAPLFWSTK
ncbi:MAG: hypothetical protein QOC61_1658 [Acidobacteriota bacterium]|jgi:hypothetical protein|nr:hypothetical protein [Acidobacteriota bacterium]